MSNNDSLKNAQKKYGAKVQKYTVKFSLSDKDISTVNTFNLILDELGVSANAYLKKMIEREVDNFYKNGINKDHV